MASKLQQASIHSTSDTAHQDNAVQEYPAEFRAVLSRVEVLLQEGEPRQALQLLARSKLASPWATNATGVCLLRLGEAERAIALFRNLLLSGGLFVRPEVPTAWKINFATALLLTDNAAGCVRLLAEIQEEDHPGVQRLRAAIRDWHNQLSGWQRIQWFLGRQPAHRVELRFPPGEL